MPSISFCFKVHQPCHLRKYSFNDIEISHNYEDIAANTAAINEVADTCYLPANELLYSLIKRSAGKFKVSFSISGTVLELLQQHRPDVIWSFRKLVETGCVEILAETYNNSLSWLHSTKEFQRQIEKHGELVRDLLGAEPTVFRNTELIYNNDLAKYIAATGYKGILCEGLEKILKGRSPNLVYAAPDNGDFGVLLRNIELSDDIAFRFGEVNWKEHPLTADKFAEWIQQHPVDNTNNINLFLDYETFGLHKKVTTGIFNFLEGLPQAVLNNTNYSFSTPTEALDVYYPKDIYDVPQIISWEDKSRQCCVWSENMMQNNAIKKLYRLERLVMDSENEQIINMWGRLQSADFFYFMSGRERSEGEAYHELNPFSSTQEAYENYNNILTDFEISLIKASIAKNRSLFARKMSHELY